MLKSQFFRISFFLVASIWLISCGNQKDNQVSTQDVVTNTTQTEKKSIGETMRANSHLPIEEQADLYRKLKKEDPEGYNFDNEDEMTMYGYSYLWDNKVPEATVIFKLIVEYFPNSSNPYDSLGEAFLAAGDTTLALKNYQKSLDLNPDNFAAEDQIERMKNPDVIPPTFEELFLTTLPKTDYIADLDQLGNKLIETNPSALKFTSKEDFWKLIEQKKALITDKTTLADFRWHVNEVVAAANCSHTGTGRLYNESRMLPDDLRFPVNVWWTGEQLFVSDPLANAEFLSAGMEIKAINGVTTGDLVVGIYKHISSQGHIETSKKYEFNHWATTMITYELGFPEKYEVRIDGQIESIALQQNEEMDNFVEGNSFSDCGEPLCLEFLDENETAILTVLSFNFYPWNNLDKFQAFMDESFEEIRTKQTKNLVIDVRGNGGGSPESSIYLLKYLMSEPFTYFTHVYNGVSQKQEPFNSPFDGKLYFLIDGVGNSTTGHFMAIAKDKGLGTIIGEELGSNHTCTAGQNVLRLKNSKVEFYVANTVSSVAVESVPDDQGVMPDYFVGQSIEDYLDKRDPVKEFALELIHE